MPPAQPHDAIFRALLEIPGFADALIRWLLPTDIVALLPDEPFMLVESSFVDSELRTTRADAVFSIRLTDGRTLLVILEHKSSPEARTPLQMAEYMVSVWRSHVDREGWTPAPVIVPIVVYQGARQWTAARSIAELAGRAGDPLRYEFLDLVRTPFSELPPDGVVRSGLAILKYALDEDPSYEDLLESMRNLRLRDPELKSRIASYMVATYHLTPEALERLFREADPELWETVMPTVAEVWKKEGEAKGKAETLLRQLERRFGDVPEDAATRVLAAPLEDLDAWLDAFVSASSLDDVFRNGAIH